MKLKHLILAICTFALILGCQTRSIAVEPAPSHQHQPGQIAQVQPSVQPDLQDALNPDNTPVLQSIAACLPAVPTHRTPFQFGILSFADGTLPSGENGRYFYVEVTPVPPAQPQSLPVEPWYTVIGVTAAGACENYLPQNSMISLSRIVPFEIATQFAQARYDRLASLNPAAYEDAIRTFTTGTIDFSVPGSPMDAEFGCEIFPEDRAALEQRGITVSSNCQVVESPSTRRRR